ncbi:MAG: HlyC/CorC family transporter [Lachnospiraceae bacterium]
MIEYVPELVLIVIFILLSAFFSGSETAFTSISRVRITTLADQGNSRARMVLSILDKNKKFLSAVLIGNNIVNIAASATATSLAIDLFGDAGAGIATGVLTFVLLIFGEITPKTVAQQKAEKISMAIAPIIRVIMIILTPFIFIINALCSGFIWLFGGRKTENKAISADEVRTIAKMSHEQGGIETQENQIINNLFDFGDTQAKDVMVPQIDMTMLSVDATQEEFAEVFRKTQYSRFPVYEGKEDNIVGILNIKDLFLAMTPGEPFPKLADVIRKPYFTYETKNVSELFREMQRQNDSIAIVLDEFGSVAGMISTEDLIEEIVGEIHDEYDTDEREPLKQLRPGVYRVAGTYKLEDINERTGTHFSSEDNDSIGGLVIERFDRFPRAGESIDIEGVTLTVIRAGSNRVDEVLMKIHKRAGTL